MSKPSDKPAQASNKRRATRWDRLKIASIYRRKRGHPNHYIAEDDEGRANLKALFRCGLSDEDAQQCAPWLEDAELRTLRLSGRRMAFDDIGKVIGLSFRNWLRYKATRFWPCDVPRDKVERFKRRRKLRRDRAGNQRNRELATA